MSDSRGQVETYKATAPSNLPHFFDVDNFKYGFMEAFEAKLLDRMEQNREIFERVFGTANSAIPSRTGCSARCSISLTRPQSSHSTAGDSTSRNKEVTKERSASEMELLGAVLLSFASVSHSSGFVKYCIDNVTKSSAWETESNASVTFTSVNGTNSCVWMTLTDDCVAYSDDNGTLTDDSVTLADGYLTFTSSFVI